MRVGEVEPGSPAAQAGIKPNDVILRLDGVPNPKWEEAELRVSTSAGEAIPLEIARRGRKLSTTLTPKTDRRTGTGFAGWQPCVPALVGLVEPGLPAGQAGLKPGDQIVAVDDKQISCWQDLAPTLQSGDGKPIILTVRRDGREIRFDLTPVYGDVAGIQKWHIGVGLRDLVVVRQLPWPQAVSSAVEESLRNSLLTFEVIGKILTRHMSPKSLSGPIGIAQLSGQAYRSGVPDLLMFVSFISLQLAIFNLLPIPVLDGGVILLLLVEGVIGRDLSVAFKERVVQVGLAVLLLLAVFVMYNDLVKTFRAY